MSLDYRDWQEMALQYARRHAPKGGVTAGGKHYPGGQFVPKGADSNRSIIDEEGTFSKGAVAHRPIDIPGDHGIISFQPGQPIPDQYLPRLSSEDELESLEPFINAGQWGPSQSRYAPVADHEQLLSYWDKRIDAALENVKQIEKRPIMKKAAMNVLNKYTTDALRRFTANTKYIRFYNNQTLLTHSDPELVDMMEHQGLPEKDIKVGGFYRRSDKSLNIDGGTDTGETWGNSGTGTTESIYAHEFVHAVDGDVEYGKWANISLTDEWIEAGNEEIIGDWKPGEEPPLSMYAMTQPAEGFAEFGRYIYENGKEAAETKFPKCYAVFKKHGLV